MKRLLIVHFSRTGDSRQLAEAARDGALDAGDVELEFLTAGAAGPEAAAVEAEASSRISSAEAGNAVPPGRLAALTFATT